MRFTKMYKKFLLCTLAWTSSYYAMHHSNVLITNLEQIMPFAERIVAYTSTSHECGNKRGFSFCEDPSVKYAYIDPQGAFTMAQLISVHERPHFNVLTDEKIKKSGLVMRKITIKEMNTIVHLLAIGHAQFDDMYLYHEGLTNFINRHIEKIKADHY